MSESRTTLSKSRFDWSVIIKSIQGRRFRYYFSHVQFWQQIIKLHSFRICVPFSVPRLRVLKFEQMIMPYCRPPGPRISAKVTHANNTHRKGNVLKIWKSENLISSHKIISTILKTIVFIDLTKSSTLNGGETRGFYIFLRNSLLYILHDVVTFCADLQRFVLILRYFVSKVTFCVGFDILWPNKWVSEAQQNETIMSLIETYDSKLKLWCCCLVMWSFMTIAHLLRILDWWYLCSLPYGLSWRDRLCRWGL